MNNFYTENCTVTSGLCDTRFNLSLSGMLDIFQNIQTAHTLEMGVDAATLKRKCNAFWAITRTQIHINKLPRWHETITATTWPTPPSLAKAERQLFLLNSSGEQAVTAKCEWCCLDCDTHRIRKLSSITCYPDMPHRQEKAFEGGFLPITDAFEPSDLVYTARIRYSHLDFNHHTNNIKYVGILMDCFNAEFWDSVSVSDFEIVYQNESREGDLIDVYSRHMGNKITFSGKRQSDGKDIFKALILLR
jgi:acyl-ACP thioesterase